MPISVVPVAVIPVPVVPISNMVVVVIKVSVVETGIVQLISLTMQKITCMRGGDRSPRMVIGQKMMVRQVCRVYRIHMVCCPDSVMKSSARVSSVIRKKLRTLVSGMIDSVQTMIRSRMVDR